MNDAPKTEAQAAAATLIAEYGVPKTLQSFERLLALAYAHGAHVAASEAVRRCDALVDATRAAKAA